MLKDFYRKMIEPRVSILGVAVMLVVVACAMWFGGTLGSEKRQSALLGVAPLGTEVFTDVASFRVEKVREDAVGAMPYTPREGFTFIIPTITVTNLSNETRDLIPSLTLYIKDADGNVYNMAMAPVEGEQFGGPVPAHDKVRQEIAFEVKKGAKGLVLYFETGGTVLMESL